MQEEMSVVRVPVMTKTSFISTERDIGEAWMEELRESMAEAGREEKRLAEERKEYYQGVPAITVIVDGGWSKRSHKHSYNVNSGVGIIIVGSFCTLRYGVSTATHAIETFPPLLQELEQVIL